MSNEINTGGPAFPHSVYIGMNHDCSTGKNEPVYSDQPGAVTLRDYFAAKAMQAQVSNPLKLGDDEVHRLIAERAYRMADAMIAAREKGGAA